MVLLHYESYILVSLSLSVSPSLSLSPSLTPSLPLSPSSHAASPPGPNEFVKISAGVASVGKPKDFPSYGWDNEYGLAETQWVDIYFLHWIRMYNVITPVTVQYVLVRVYSTDCILRVCLLFKMYYTEQLSCICTRILFEM